MLRAITEVMVWVVYEVVNMACGRQNGLDSFS